MTDTSTVYVVTGNPAVPDSLTAVSINLADDTLLPVEHDDRYPRQDWSNYHFYPMAIQ